VRAYDVQVPGMSAINITSVSGFELHQQYPTEHRAQPCFVELDARTGALSASYNPEIGNAVPLDMFNGHVLRWDIPSMKEKPANALLAAIAPIAQRIVDGYDAQWRGHEAVATYTSDASDAQIEIDALCHSVDEADRIVVWTAAELLGPLGSDEVQARELGITAESTDEELDAIAAETVKSADEIDIIVGLDGYLKRLREVSQAETRKAA